MTLLYIHNVYLQATPLPNLSVPGVLDHMSAAHNKNNYYNYYYLENSPKKVRALIG